MYYLMIGNPKKVIRHSLIKEIFYKKNNHPEKTATKFISDLLHI